MSVQDSQARREFSYAELCEEARKRSAEIAAKEAANAEKKGKGLEYMSLRFNIIDKRRQLQVDKKITPAEYFLLEEIELGTIGGRNSKSTVCSEAEFFLEDLARNMGCLKNKVYVNLKSLHAKGLITRKATRSKGREILGLNPETFGQILSDHFQYKESTRKRSLWLAVDNSKDVVDKSEHIDPISVPNKDDSDPELGSNESQLRTSQVHNQDQNESHPNDIINENPALDSSRCILDSSRGQNRRQETYVSQDKKPGTGSSTKGEMTPEEIELEKKRQLSMARNAGIL